MTDVFVYPGESNPADVVVRDPTTSVVPITLAGVAACTVTATADLQTAITMAGTAAGVATMTAVASTSINLAAAVTCSATATADLSTAIRLAGVAAGVGQMTASLDTTIRLAGVAACAATAVGSLTTAINLAGAAAVSATATGALVVGSPASTTLSGGGGRVRGRRRRAWPAAPAEPALELPMVARVRYLPDVEDRVVIAAPVVPPPPLVFVLPDVTDDDLFAIGLL